MLGMTVTVIAPRGDNIRESIKGRDLVIRSCYGHFIVPFVLIGLGLYIMVQSGALRLLRVW